MNDKWQASYATIADSPLVRPLSHSQRKSFLSAGEPLFWLIAHELIIDTENFYADAAKLLKLPYADDLPTRINSSNSLAYSIGPAVLSKLCAFPYRKDDKTVIACAEPIHAQKVIDICKQKGPSRQKFAIVLAAPNTIRTAIAETNYQQSAAAAELYLDIANPPYSSKNVLTPGMRFFVAFLAVALVVFFFWHPPLGFFVFFVIINIFYLIFNFVRIVVTLRPRKKEVSPDLPDVLNAPAVNLPVYTILVPLKDEASMVPQLLKRLRALEYPAEKLDIKLVAEVTDTSTISALAKEGVNDMSTGANSGNAEIPSS